MLGVGKKFPEFQLKATVSREMGKAFKDLSFHDLKGKWAVLFFYPKDFTFVCPTEIKAFDDLYAEFKKRDCLLLTASTDSEFVHLAWRQHHAELKDLQMPMLSDIKRELSMNLGILDEAEGVAQRATYILDPKGIIRFVSVNDLSVGRNPHEVLRVLDGLQTGELVPCNWQKGQPTLKVG